MQFSFHEILLPRRDSWRWRPDLRPLIAPPPFYLQQKVIHVIPINFNTRVRGRGVRGGGACVVGGMYGRGGGGVHGRGHTWQGCVCGRGHVWQGGMHGGGGASVAGVCEWQGICMAGVGWGWGGGEGRRSLFLNQWILSPLTNHLDPVFERWYQLCRWHWTVGHWPHDLTSRPRRLAFYRPGLVTWNSTKFSWPNYIWINFRNNKNAFQ